MELRRKTSQNVTKRDKCELVWQTSQKDAKRCSPQCTYVLNCLNVSVICSWFGYSRHSGNLIKGTWISRLHKIFMFLSLPLFEKILCFLKHFLVPYISFQITKPSKDSIFPQEIFQIFVSHECSVVTISVILLCVRRCGPFIHVQSRRKRFLLITHRSHLYTAFSTQRLVLSIWYSAFETAHSLVNFSEAHIPGKFIVCSSPNQWYQLQDKLLFSSVYFQQIRNNAQG